MPQTRNMSLHDARDEVLCSPIPYMSREPTICATALQVIQQLLILCQLSVLPWSVLTNPIRSVCSLFLYQILVIVINAGLTAPSAAPKKNRIARKPWYVFGAERHIQTAPQTTLMSVKDLYTFGFELNVHCDTHKL